MYILSACITLLWSFIVLFYLPTDPIKAKHFTERERFIAVTRLQINNTGVKNTHFKKAQLWEVCLDYRFWLLFSLNYLGILANGPISAFGPILTHSFGFNTLDSLLLVIPQGFIQGCLNLSITYIAYRIKNSRTILISLMQLGPIIGGFIMWLVPRTEIGAGLFAFYILGSFQVTYTLSMGLQLANCGGYTKRTITAASLFVANSAASITGPLLFKADQAPIYGEGFAIILACSFATAIIAQVYRLDCLYENKRRDRAGHEAYQHAYDDMTDKQNPQFRYTL